MSGALKHRQRSHKTYRKNVNSGVFNDFERKAKTLKIKKQNKTLFQSVKEKVLQPVKEKLFKKQSR